MILTGPAAAAEHHHIAVHLVAILVDDDSLPAFSTAFVVLGHHRGVTARTSSRPNCEPIGARRYTVLHTNRLPNGSNLGLGWMQSGNKGHAIIEASCSEHIPAAQQTDDGTHVLTGLTAGNGVGVEVEAGASSRDSWSSLPAVASFAELLTECPNDDSDMSTASVGIGVSDRRNENGAAETRRGGLKRGIAPLRMTLTQVHFYSQEKREITRVASRAIKVDTADAPAESDSWSDGTSSPIESSTLEKQKL